MLEGLKGLGEVGSLLLTLPPLPEQRRPRPGKDRRAGRKWQEVAGAGWI